MVFALRTATHLQLSSLEGDVTSVNTKKKNQKFIATKIEKLLLKFLALLVFVI